MGKFLQFYPVPSILHKHVQADATAYFGSVQVSATLWTKIFSFRIVINLSKFDNDLDAIVVSLVRSNLVEKIFSFSGGQNQRTFSVGVRGGIDAVNASRVFPEIRLIENRLVVFEDSVIYQEELPSTEELPTILDFDLNLIIVGRHSVTIEQFLPFAVGTVALTLPLDEYQNNNYTSNFGDFNCSQINGCEPNPCQNDAMCTNNIFFECFCNARWMDEQCEAIIDYCASDMPINGPCNDNSGAIACNDGSPMYSCTCAAGFTGYNCSEDIDGCDPNPCQNDAICINLLHGAFQCLCNAGWTGELCDTDIDYCALDSSLHGPCDDTGASNCTEANSTYVCTCTAGFTGYNCSEDIDECDPNPCQNDAICINLLHGAFQCLCNAGWTGELCDTDIDYCALDSSLHGPCDDTGASNCTEANSTYVCTCAAGFTSYNCSEDIDECDPNPCQNGAICTNLLHGAFQCSCSAGWTGELCDIDTDYCALDSSLYGPCDDNGATNCTDTNSTYVCTCAVGFTGYDCSQDINECEPNPCHNSVNCTNLLYGSFECHCHPGWSGQLCEIDIDYCALDSSLHGPCDDTGARNCTDSNSTYSCECAVGYTGYNCSQDINECDSNPCQNGAICINLLHGAFQCLCSTGWTGELCDTDIDYCASDSSLHGPCHDTGTINCTDGNLTYHCNCAAGFTGYNCSEDIDECDPNPCENGGKCTNLLQMYECECPNGFSGETCNTFSDPCTPSQPCRRELECSRGMYNCNCLCVAQCPLFTFGDHSTGDCQPCKLINISMTLSTGIIQWKLNHHDSQIQGKRQSMAVTETLGGCFIIN